jgi:hypothetical protein
MLVRLEVDAVREPLSTYNLVGELPGADDDNVIIGSHHDGPWSSAVEDGSGIALVLAQVAYWSRLPRAQRPHRLVVLLNAGHMCGGAGTRAFIDAHRAELDRVVLEVHLEHAASEFAERDGALQATGHPEARWWFTSRIARLEAAVGAAIEAERLGRSLVLPPDAFSPASNHRRRLFHLAGVPLVNLTAPFYLRCMDTMDKIHAPALSQLHARRSRISNRRRGVRSECGMREEDLPQKRLSQRASCGPSSCDSSSRRLPRLPRT